jgi:hypothetical protein
MDDKRRILDMVAEKKISSEEAMKLLSAIDEKKMGNGNPGRYLKIVVYKNDLDKPKVNISIPIMLVKLGAKFAPKDKQLNLDTEAGNTNFDLSGLDWDELLKLASKGEIGDIFSADIEEDNGGITKVRIFIE